MANISVDDIVMEVDPHGAYVRRLEYKGRPLLFPYTEFKDGKVRGGMHVCLPNFGPAPDQDLNQHGFGREATWQLTTGRADGASEVRCRLNTSSTHKVAPKRYHGMYVRLVYGVALNPETNTIDLSADVTILNRGRQEITIAPAFHPYFAIPMVDTPEDIAVITEPEDAEYRFSKTVWAQSPIIDVSTNRHVIIDAPATPPIVVGQVNLPQYVCWSDGRLDEHSRYGYVCVEPTAHGFAFADPANVRGDVLEPGAGKVYSINFSWVID